MVRTIELYGLILAGSAQAWGVAVAAIAVVLLALAAGVALRRSARASEHEAEHDPLRRLAGGLARENDLDGVARVLLGELGARFRVDFAALTLVSEDQREAAGVLACTPDGDVDWWPSVRIDLQHEPSGVASAVFEAAAVTVYDASSSARVSTRLAQALGAKSVAHAPLLVGERVVAVVSLATTAEHRSFTQDDLATMGRFSAEAAAALQRVRVI